MRRITCSFIALTLDIHVLSLRREAETAILHATKKVGSSCYKIWAGLNGFDPRTDFVLGGERIGMDCMNPVTVISRYTQVL